MLLMYDSICIRILAAPGRHLLYAVGQLHTEATGAVHHQAGVFPVDEGRRGARQRLLWPLFHPPPRLRAAARQAGGGEELRHGLPTNERRSHWV